MKARLVWLRKSSCVPLAVVNWVWYENNQFGWDFRFPLNVPAHVHMFRRCWERRKTKVGTSVKIIICTSKRVVSEMAMHSSVLDHLIYSACACTTFEHKLPAVLPVRLHFNSWVNHLIQHTHRNMRCKEHETSRDTFTENQAGKTQFKSKPFTNINTERDKWGFLSPISHRGMTPSKIYSSPRHSLSAGLDEELSTHSVSVCERGDCGGCSKIIEKHPHPPSSSSSSSYPINNDSYSLQDNNFWGSSQHK